METKKKSKKSSGTYATQTRGLTDVQKGVNGATGVNNSYNFNSGAARDAARTFAEYDLEQARASGNKASITAARNVLRRKSMGGKGG